MSVYNFTSTGFISTLYTSIANNFLRTMERNKWPYTSGALWKETVNKCLGFMVISPRHRILHQEMRSDCFVTIDILVKSRRSSNLRSEVLEQESSKLLTLGVIGSSLEPRSSPQEENWFWTSLSSSQTTIHHLDTSHKEMFSYFLLLQSNQPRFSLTIREH